MLTVADSNHHHTTFELCRSANCVSCEKRITNGMLPITLSATTCKTDTNKRSNLSSALKRRSFPTSPTTPTANEDVNTPPQKIRRSSTSSERSLQLKKSGSSKSSDSEPSSSPRSSSPFQTPPSPAHEILYLSESPLSKNDLEEPFGIHSGRKSSLSLNLFKPSLSDENVPTTPAFTITDKATPCAPPSPAHSEESAAQDYYSHKSSAYSLKNSQKRIEFAQCPRDSSDEKSDLEIDEENIKFWISPESPQSLPLTPFANQVGGHTSFFRFSQQAVCKPLARRENHFYEVLETKHPELLPFVPEYLGVLNVTYRSQDGEETVPEVVFEQNKHLLPKWLRERFHDQNRPCSSSQTKNCHRDQTVSKKIQEKVLREVFSSRALRRRLREHEPSVKRRHSMISMSPRQKIEDLPAELSRSFTEINLSDKEPKHRPSNSYSDSSRIQPMTSMNDEFSSTEFGEVAPSSPYKYNDHSTFSAPEQSLSPQPHDSEITSVFRMDGIESPSKTPMQEMQDQEMSDANQSVPPTWAKAKTNNPWSLHCYTTQLSKLQSNNTEKLQQFILLEDLTQHLRYPCVLDLKMGTRQYGIDSTDEKRKSQTRKCAKTTSKTLGVRLCGMQVYKTTEQDFVFQDKYYGRSLKPENFHEALASFLHNGERILLQHIPPLVRKLRRLAKIIRGLEGYRFYASSLLLLYDGEVENGREIDIRLIDFAHCTTSDDYPHSDCRFPPSHGGFDRGYLLGLRNLCRSFEMIYEKRCGPLGNVGESEDNVFEGINDWWCKAQELSE